MAQSLLTVMERRHPCAEALYKDLVEDFAHHADVMIRFKSARPPLEHLINMVPILKPRAYSIASSPSMHPDMIHLCVVTVDWKVPTTGELRIGEATGHMRVLRLGGFAHGRRSSKHTRCVGSACSPAGRANRGDEWLRTRSLVMTLPIHRGPEAWDEAHMCGAAECHRAAQGPFSPLCLEAAQG